jgi:hypothetical protein
MARARARREHEGMKGNVTDLPRSTSRRGQDGRAMRHGGRRAGRPPGRAWLNAREVGGADPRYAHLAVTHD